MGNVQMEASMIRYGSGTVKSALDNGGGGGSAKTLASLTDTDITTPSNGQVLTYDGTSEKWENAAIPAPATPSLAGLSDTAITEPSNGQVLTYNSTSGKWENASGGGGSDPYTVVLIPEHTPTTANYEQVASVTLPAGIYHFILAAYSNLTAYPAGGVKASTTGNQDMLKSEVSGIQSQCCHGAVDTATLGTTFNILAKGNTASKISGYYMYRKIADVNNNR